jgi:lipopolysaccharide transport system ATP-binding protein
LRAINLEIRRGEKIGIIGRNGAGKSTLLKIITGNIQPTEGTVSVNGRVQALLELGTGFHPEFTGRENIKASLAYQGLSSKVIAKKEEEIIDFAELEEFIDQPIKTYSAGMYARLAFSTATSIEPDILIIDEVLGAGDAYFMNKCIERMRRLTSDRGVTVLYVSHDLGSVQALCDRIAWIKQGSLYADGEPLMIIKQYSAAVRHDEEIRLIARDLKISKKQAVLLEREQDLYDTLLFRFAESDAETPQEVNIIRSICLKHNSEEIGRINPGAPMDNQPGKGFILDEPGLMNWGPASRDVIGYYRAYGDFEGKYGHAPFQFLIAKGYSTEDDMVIEIDAQFKSNKTAVDLYNPYSHTYERLGIFRGDNILQVHSFNVPVITHQGENGGPRESLADEPAADEPAADEPAADEPIADDPVVVIAEVQSNQDIATVSESEALQESIDVRFTEVCKILGVQLFDKMGKSAKVFSFENNISVVSISLKFSVALSRFSTALIIFSNRGDMVLYNLNELIFESIKDTFTLNYHIQRVRLGPGEFLISFAVYEEIDVLDNSKEGEPLAVIDRAVSFKIEQPIGFNLNLGFCIPEIPLSVCSEREATWKCRSYL